MEDKKKNAFEKYKEDLKEGKIKYQEFSTTEAFKQRMIRLEKAIYDRLKIKRK
ncbi:MAG: hypothetical protein HC875_15285 [Anaerolineales bacterium]|nr:hypothetical protein [Anaerolineales bacterium]